jgi:hypothetical protein
MAAWKNRGAWATLLITVIVGWILNHVLDLTASGAFKMWGGVLRVVSFGSERVRDTPFESAALNPYPIPALFILFAGSILLLLVVIVITLHYFFIYLRLRHIWGLSSSATRKPSRSDKIVEAIARSPVRFLLSVGSAFAILYLSVAGLIIPLLMLNEATLARRFYEADRDAILPYLSQPEAIQLQSDFAQVRTKDDYLLLMNQMAKVASIHHVKFHNLGE